MKTKLIVSVLAILFVVLTYGMAQNAAPATRRSNGAGNATARQEPSPSPSRNSPCSLAIEQAPELRGFRLGMTLDQIRQRFSEQSVLPPDDVGEQRIRLSRFLAGQDSENRTDFTNVRDIELKFLDSVLFSVAVTYDASVRFEGQQDFLTRVAGGLNLPNRWELMVGTGQGVLCRGFNVVAIYNQGLLPRVTLLKTSVAETIFDRRREQEERRRQTFQP